MTPAEGTDVAALRIQIKEEREEHQSVIATLGAQYGSGLKKHRRWAAYWVLAFCITFADVWTLTRRLQQLSITQISVAASALAIGMVMLLAVPKPLKQVRSILIEVATIAALALSAIAMLS